MKKVTGILLMAVVMFSCRNTPDTKVLSAADSAELSEFKEWKKQKEAAAHTTVVYKNNEASTPKKKGWSNAAKGAVIGAGTGAVAGAVINKRNRAAGAVVGGVVGAGVGYTIGRAKDKKSGGN